MFSNTFEMAGILNQSAGRFFWVPHRKGKAPWLLGRGALPLERFYLFNWDWGIRHFPYS